ncbi:hypothetical protein GW781_01025 [bacterium]|nr:hypothetical protein [bacterium]
MTAQPFTPRPQLFVANDPYPLRISTALAIEIGFNESVVLLQLETLISLSNTAPRDGLLWTYQSLNDLAKYFPWWGRETINRAIKSLQQKGLIRIANFNQWAQDRTHWYALDPQGISKLQSVHLDVAAIESEIQRREAAKPISQNETPISQNGKCPGEKSHFSKWEMGKNRGISQNETPISQNETTIPLVKPESLTTTTNTQKKQKMAVAVEEKKQNPDEFSLLELASLNHISRKKLTEMQAAGITGAAFASWLGTAMQKDGLKDPIAAAIVTSLDYPQGEGGMVSAFFARPRAEALDLLAQSLAGYPVSEKLFQRLTRERQLRLFLALGGEQQAIPEKYHAPAPVYISPAPAAANEAPDPKIVALIDEGLTRIRAAAAAAASQQRQPAFC